MSIAFTKPQELFDIKGKIVLIMGAGSGFGSDKSSTTRKNHQHLFSPVEAWTQRSIAKALT